MVSRGFKPLGAEPVTVELNSDADHIITPSEVYPRHCIRNALKKTGIKPDDIETFDLHATATPGDWAEINSVHEVLGDKPYFTARKGIFGHGMAVSGGWELTAQYMGMEEGVIFRTNDKKVQLHRAIEKKHPRIVTNEEIPYKGGYVGKISMGVGGINGVVISKPLSFDLLPFQFATLAGISINKLKKLIDEGTIEKKIDEFGLTRIPFRELKKLNGNKS
jgi:3-oxoacyl-(acyl-carrier-protein) synthase